MVPEHIHRLEERLNLVRGRLTASYGSIEFRLADLFVKCQKLPEYSQLADDFPRTLYARIEAIEALLRLPGPLDLFAERLRSSMQEIKAYSVLRHFLVHGYGILEADDDSHILTYQMYQKKPGSDWYLDLHKTNVDELEAEYNKLNAYADAMWHFFKEIYRDTGIA